MIKLLLIHWKPYILYTHGCGLGQADSSIRPNRIGHDLRAMWSGNGSSGHSFKAGRAPKDAFSTGNKSQGAGSGFLDGREVTFCIEE